MNIAGRRLSLAAASLLMAALGAASLFLSVDRTDAADQYTIEIDEEGINPASCTVNKGTAVQWKNVGSEVHRIVRPGAGVEAAPLFDTGDLEPGETSRTFGFTLRENWLYEDFYNPELTARIIVPNSRGLESCELQAPTPTPSPTPLPTATPDPRRAFMAGVSRGESQPTPTSIPTETPTPTPMPTETPEGE